MGNIYSTTQFILLQKIFCCFWFFHCCLHHSFCIIFNVVLCSVLGQFVSSNMMYCTDWSDIACLVLQNVLDLCLEALVFWASISMSGDGMFEMRHTHIIFFTWLYWWNFLSFTIFSFFFFPFSIKHIFCIPSLNFLCSQMLMWSKVSCKQPWSRIMCNTTF